VGLAWVGGRYAHGMRHTPTALVAAGSLIIGYAVAVSSGSRAAGGVVLGIGGLWCIWTWAAQHGRRTATVLGGVGLVAFAISHLLALAIGAWPSVLLSAGAVALSVWCYADAPVRTRRALGGEPTPADSMR
jgi:hypothetical protein